MEILLIYNVLLDLVYTLKYSYESKILINVKLKIIIIIFFIFIYFSFKEITFLCFN